MSQWEKLTENIKNMSQGIRFSELKKILEYYGYVMNSPGSGSSHCTFRKANRSPITIPMHEPIKKIYVKMVKEVIESEDTDNENS